ncbi:hypothetical protein G7Z17_g7973 [Cylindrodendrum hubeiense]|uniref:Uncharacterized protein n=1 Tax=Cylindrodendrum hubeiense TaxID=595255 RepID=A0A9P5H636_9HYPO|nr:hypothetical protein G7Z17_g7973 [Cylindrodendrum hubeiense]
MIFTRSTLALLVATTASWGVNAVPCKATITSMPAAETSTSAISSAPITSMTTTTTVPEPEPTLTSYRLFRPRNARREEEEEYLDEPAWSLRDGATIEEDTEIAHSGDHYVLVRIENDEKTPSIEENIVEDIETGEPGILSYSWALAEAYDLGKDGVCSIVSKLDGIVIDTLEFSSNPANRYQDHEVNVSFHSPQPVLSMDFFCSGDGFSRVDVLLDDVCLAAVPVNQDLR